MIWLYIVLAWMGGVFTPFIALVAFEFFDEVIGSLRLWRWKRVNYGKWVIESHAGSGSDYSNGGRYTICRAGFWDVYRPATTRQWVRWEPPMKTEADALAECARLNALQQ